MKDTESAHRDAGIKALLALPHVYELFQCLVARKRTRTELVEKGIMPFPGCRILDIGCGTGDIPTCLPKSIGKYEGFDMNPAYIESATKRWMHNDKCRFFCANVRDVTATKPKYYDIVLALGILHHLTDDEAIDLLDIAHQALRDNGVLVTYDNVYVENQHWFAKWLISRDRGKAVRTVEGYRKLIEKKFLIVDDRVLHDTLKVPYTIFQTRCIKGKADASS